MINAKMTRRPRRVQRIRAYRGNKNAPLLGTNLIEKFEKTLGGRRE